MDLSDYIIANVTDDDKEKVLETINKLKNYFKEDK